MLKITTTALRITKQLYLVFCLIFITFQSTSAIAIELKDLESFQKLPLVQQEVLLQEEALLREEIAQKTPVADSQAEAPVTGSAPATTAPTTPTAAHSTEEKPAIDPRLERVKSVDDRGATDPLNTITDQNQRIKNIQLPRFGADVFAGQATTFAPVNDIPVPTDYILGPGDQINIQLYGGKNDLYKLVIDRNGAIAFPGLGPVNIAGLSFSEASVELKKHVETLGIGVNSSITLGDLRSFRIFVMGESNLPGSYLVSGMATITHALYVSGGISDIGSFRHIQLRRHGKLVKTLDLYDLLIHGNTQNDVRLQPGDTVFIPVKNTTVAINGEVRRPAIYEIKNEKTFADLIKLAGGVKADAYLTKAKVTRVSHQGFAQIKALDLAQQKDMQQSLQNGDLLTISGISSELDGVVTLSGEVQRPGIYPWHPGQTLNELIQDEQAFKRHADLDYLVVLRQARNGADYQVLSTHWSAQATPAFELQARDRVFVFQTHPARSRNNAPASHRIPTQTSKPTHPTADCTSSRPGQISR
jgi:polysaccharide export outer membrane protein